MTLVVPPDAEPQAAVLLLHGSSGRPDIQRATLLAEHGAAVLVPKWFGDEGQPPGICEVPLEYFQAAVDDLRSAYPQLKVGVMGVSKGAEAALLVAAHDRRISSVVALAPTSVVWANVGPGWDGVTYPYRSSWSLGGRPVSFVPYDEEWSSAQFTGPVPYRGQYERSLAVHADRVEDATIPVEDVRGQMLLVCGGDDQMWPSAWFAEQVRARRTAHGLTTQVVSDPEAGHLPALPGETPRPPNGRIDHGGSEAANRRLGAAAWPQIRATLGLS